MSDSDESAVIVEHNDAPPPELKDEAEGKDSNQGTDGHMDKDAHASQIVSVGTGERQFTFHKERWNEILSRVPVGWKVAVVSVVGAFRTGKSFLLNWFLRYLYALESAQKKESSMSQQNDEGADSLKKKWYEQFEKLGNDGFDWKAGSKRNTTGIWMWNHPFFLKQDNGEEVAVLLVDTQGMFDNETTVSLTASIFGLSTLLSSYQIYNVNKQIQEDNLQQLALFTEYARTAMDGDERESKPFQKIEFLVRDWQNFNHDDEDNENYQALEQSVVQYLDEVLEEREAADLRDTREQIRTCFEDISCYALCHPGLSVPRKTYDGSVAELEKLFVALLDRYCRRVFSTTSLQPKQIHGRELTAVELGSYIQAYADLFVSGKKFPEASTLLEATSSANNNNAVSLGLTEYKDGMDRVAGPICSNYLKPEELADEHRAWKNKGLKVFKSVATFGSRKGIENAEKDLHSKIDGAWQVYESLNNSRNPLLGLETYLVPMALAFVAYILRWLTDMTCSPYSQVCRTGSELLSHGYAVVFCFLAILAATKMRQIQEVWAKLRTILEATAAASAKPKMD